jgi:hypothetical protein
MRLRIGGTDLFWRARPNSKHPRWFRPKRQQFFSEICRRVSEEAAGPPLSETLANEARWTLLLPCPRTEPHKVRHGKYSNNPASKNRRPLVRSENVRRARAM